MTLDDEQLRALVERFYERVRADRTLGPIFAARIANWDDHISRLVDFWSSIMLGSGRYKGNPFSAHLPFAEALTAEAFDRWLALWRQTAQEILPPDTALRLDEKACRIARSLLAGLGNRSSDSAGRVGVINVQPAHNQRQV